MIVIAFVAVLLPLSASAAVRWGKPRVIDSGTQLSDPLNVQSLSCPSQQLCVGVAAGGTAVVSNSPVTGNWQQAAIDPGQNLLGVSCPTTGLCVAWDASGAILTSTAPAAAASAWQRTPGVLGSGADNESVSCPSSTLCVAVNGAAVFTSQDPTGGAGSWPKATLAGASGLNGVSCPTSTFCAALDPLANGDMGGVFYTTNPAGGSATWRPGIAGGFPQANNPQSIACASASWCELAGQNSDDAYYDVTDYAPAGPAPASAPSLRVGPGVNALSCGPGGCLAADAGGAIYALSTPSSRWAKAGSIDPSSTTALTCASAQLCVGATASGRLGVSQNVFTASPVWTAGLPLGGSKTKRRTLTGVSCGSTVCVAIDSAGNALVHAIAPRNVGGWRSEPVSPGNPLSLVSCTAARYCAISSASSVFSSASPAGDRWTDVDLDLWDNPDGKSDDTTFDLDAIDSLSCGAISFCAEVSTDNSGGFGIGSPTFQLSSHPGTSSWADPKADRLLNQTPNQDFQPDWVACASARTCLVEADPVVGVMTAGGRHWRYVKFGGKSTPTQDGSCPSVSFCALTGDDGTVFTSTDPTGASARNWRIRSLDRGRLLAVSCASSRLCVAIDLGKGNPFGTNRPSSGVLYTSTDPASRSAVWTRRQTHRQLTGVSCAVRAGHRGASVCVVVDREGEALVASSK